MYRPVRTDRVEGKQGKHTEPVGAASRKTARKVRFRLNAGPTRGSVSLARLPQGKRLPPGTYWLQISSLDAERAPSATLRVKVWVLKARRG